MSIDKVAQQAAQVHGERIAIARKGLRLQIATELYAAWLASDRSTANEDTCKLARGAALEDADALITENEAMP
jgi:hypothetical protein